MSIDSSTIADNTSGYYGGAISNVFGGVRIANSLLANNVANFGDGGAVHIRHSHPLTVDQSTFTGNSADRDGGAVYANGVVTIDESSFAQNLAGSDGGALYTPGTATINVSTFNENVADRGGAIHSEGQLTINDSTLSGNTAGFGGAVQAFGNSTITRSMFDENYGLYGGAIRSGIGHTVVRDSSLTRNVVLGLGGAVDVRSGSFALVNSTVSGNSANFAGGGIWARNTQNSTVIQHSTITDNTADADANGSGAGGGLRVENNVNVTMEHAIVAGNHDLSGAAPDVENDVHAVYSLIGIGQGAVITGGGNIVGTTTSPVDPRLGPLADNGGPTLTHALLDGSPAIDAGDVFFDPQSLSPPLDFDQRGESPFSRQFGAIDIGAYEYLALKVGSFTDESDGIVANGNLSLREAIYVANQTARVDVIEFEPQFAGQTLALTLGELVISDSLVINGLGADQLRIDALGISRVFRIDDGDNGKHIDVTINGLTLSGGNAFGPGGAVNSIENLTLSNSVVTASSARGFGGGVYVHTINGATTTIADSVVSGNSVNANYFSGGGLFVRTDAGGTTSIDRTSVSGNVVDGRYTSGGGISIRTAAGGLTRIAGSTVSGNRAQSNYAGGSYGGGVHIVSDGTTDIVGGTISGNYCNKDGGGVYAYAYNGGTITIEGTTITANVGANGGGIRATSNGGGRLTIENSIVAANSDAAAPDISGELISRYSLIGDNTGATITDSGGNLIGTGNSPIDPMLGPLADNGGATLSHAPLSGSPVIDAGSGPVAFYRFEEISGFQPAEDLMRSNNGSYQNGVSLTQNGPLAGLGDAATFDGIDDYVQLNEPLSIGSTSQTIEVWVKVPTVGSNGLDPNEPVGVILGNNNGFAGVPNANWDIDGDGAMRIFWNHELTLRGTSDLRDDQWHHLAFVRDKVAGEFRAYLDGNDESLTTHATAGADVAFTIPHRIGLDANSFAALPFHGTMDELAIYDRALTADIIALHAAGGVPVMDQRGMPYDRFSDGDGDKIVAPDLGAVEAPNRLEVDIAADERDGDYSAGDLSLREALEIASRSPDQDVITFDTGLHGQTISMTQDTMIVESSAIIIGPGADLLTIDAAGQIHIFDFTGVSTTMDSEVELTGMTITGSGRTAIIANKPDNSRRGANRKLVSRWRRRDCRSWSAWCHNRRQHILPEHCVSGRRRFRPRCRHHDPQFDVRE